MMHADPHGGSRFTGLLREYILGWLQGMRERVRASTYSRYHQIVRLHILPALGDLKLQSIAAQDVQNFVEMLRAKGLAAGTVRNIFRVLYAALKKAADTGAMETNVCKDISLPQSEPKKAPVLTRYEQMILEAAALNDPNGLAVLLALYTGMRLGEICALRWEDVDLAQRVIRVSQTMQRLSLLDGERRTAIHFGPPKSAASERDIPLPESLAVLLRAARPESGCGFVLSRNGKVAEPRICQYRFQALLQRAGLSRRVNFHALRHTFATRCMEARMDVTTLSQILGHASVKLTLDTYTDSLWEHKVAAMKALDGLGLLSA